MDKAMGGSGAAAQSSSVKSATRTLDIIEYVVAAGRPLVAQEISNALGIPVSSLSYLLSTLADRGYLQREGRRYTPGPGLERLQAKRGGFSLVERVAPLVRTLRVQLNETASFWVRHGWQIEPIATEMSEQALRYAVITGTRLPMYALASGKAVLAAMPDEELDRYFAEVKLEKFTPHTIVSEAKLRKQIAETRKTGFAVIEEEYSLGINGIGRVVRVGDEVVGALSVAIPKVRYSEALEKRAKDLLERTATLLEEG
ncbi:IclR family transcriptional regulator [Altererythrobacter fulvus]|uniref:IclR family transcriptional regulator n=1 Tax=Caenibius fulvus TaxID=2126012 RepID=UPI0030162AF7